MDCAEARQELVRSLLAHLLGNRRMHGSGQLVHDVAEDVVVGIVGGDIQHGLVRGVKAARGDQVGREVLGNLERERVLAAAHALVRFRGGGDFLPVEDVAVHEAVGDLFPGLEPGPVAGGRAGVLHGARSSLLADEDGQIADAHSISAGLDYPGVGPEHAFLRDSGRAEYVPATDEEALAAFHLLAEREGIIPALEPAHALARALELDAELVLVGLSGRGDKDLATVLSR